MQDVRDFPTAVHAETAILGAMLLDSVAIADAVNKLHPSDFSLDSHQRIYRGMLELNRSGQPVDYITLREVLDRKRELDSIGGPAYLAQLTEGIPRNLNIESYVRIVKDKARLRESMALGERLYAEASESGREPIELIEQTIEELRSIASDSDTGELRHVGAILEDHGNEPEAMFEALATVHGVNLGFAQLHETTAGPQPGELWIVAARPSMGKTAWMCNVARHTAVQAAQTPAVFTLEQKRHAIIRRMLSAAARIDYKDIRRNELRARDRELLLEHRQILGQAPLYIDDQPGLTVSRIKSRCLRLKARAGLDIVFVDQLSHISGADVYQRGMQLREVVGKQTKALKQMAQELDVPVIVFNQLSREAGKRKDFVPTLADLKESGNIEEDADVVVLLHRPEYYDKSDASLEGKGQMIIAKNREGETKTLDCIYQGRILRWEDDYEAPAQQATFTSAEDYYVPPYYDR